jgi:uncharacterized membrane protein (Fun14 family)
MTDFGAGFLIGFVIGMLLSAALISVVMRTTENK